MKRKKRKTKKERKNPDDKIKLNIELLFGLFVAYSEFGQYSVDLFLTINFFIVICRYYIDVYMYKIHRCLLCPKKKKKRRASILPMPLSLLYYQWMTP